MEAFTKRIVFIYIPHIFIESEMLRRSWDGDVSCIITTSESRTGLIIDVSGNLREKNVRKGMPLTEIKHLLNEVNIVPVDCDYLKEINERIVTYLKGYSIIVESNHFGEFYIDLTGTERLFGRVIDTCGRIISHLYELYGFNTSTGIGSNRLTAYLASRIICPNSAYEIFKASEEAFLAPVAISRMPDISRELKDEILSSYNLQTLQDIKAFSKSDLAAMFKESGDLLYNYSRNKSSHVLAKRKEEKVIREELVLSDIGNDDHMIRRKFFQLALSLCVRMRTENIFPRYFYLQVIYKDDYKFAKSKKLNTPSFIEKRLYKELLPYLEKALKRRTCIKKIVLTFSRFVPAGIQMSVFPDENPDLILCRACDLIREKYGRNAICFPE